MKAFSWKTFPWRIVLRGLVVIATLVGIGIFFREFELDEKLRDSVWIDRWIRGVGVRDEILVVGLFGVLQAVGIPRQIIGFLCGYAFGFWEGVVVCLLASELGCALDFYYARFLGRDLVQGRLGNRLRRMDAFWRKNPFTMTLMIRLLPVGNNVVTSLLGGVSSVPAVAFLTGSFVGYIPQSAVFVLLGSGVGMDATQQIVLGVVLFVASALLGMALYRRFRMDKKKRSA